MGPLPLRWLPSCTLPGAWQMAIDVWLLEQMLRGERAGPLLRFYRWSRPTLSLGRHQRALDPRWLRLAAQGRLSLVRRPSGGAAVLHGGDLTYGLLWPEPPRQRRQAYALSCRWLQEAFRTMGQPLVFGAAACRGDQANCFATGTAADLVHPDGAKRIGSAQMWRGGSLLQHGSVLIEPDAALWEEVFGGPAPRLPALPLAGDQLERHLLQAAQRFFPPEGREGVSDGSGARLLAAPLQGWEWGAIAPLVAAYELPELMGSGSELSAIALATGSSAPARPTG